MLLSRRPAASSRRLDGARSGGKYQPNAIRTVRTRVRTSMAQRLAGSPRAGHDLVLSLRNRVRNLRNPVVAVRRSSTTGALVHQGRILGSPMFPAARHGYD